MALDPRKVESVRRRQREMFAKVLDRRTYNMTITEIAERSGLDDSSISNYAGGVTTMSLVAIDALVDIIPDELLSMLLPSERIILRKPVGINHEQACQAMTDYVTAKLAAHHPDSECGPAIGPNEDADLRGRLAVVVGGLAA